VNLMSTRCGAWIYVLCFSLLSGFAQQNGPAGQSLPPASVPLASSNRQMTLDVVVTDSPEGRSPDCNSRTLRS
jgi:hypothetical protein